MISEVKKLRNTAAKEAERLIKNMKGLNRYAIEKRDSHNYGLSFNTFGVAVFLSGTPDPKDTEFICVSLYDFSSMDENVAAVAEFLENIKKYVPRTAPATVPA